MGRGSVAQEERKQPKSTYNNETLTNAYGSQVEFQEISFNL